MNVSSFGMIRFSRENTMLTFITCWESEFWILCFSHVNVSSCLFMVWISCFLFFSRWTLNIRINDERRRGCVRVMKEDFFFRAAECCHGLLEKRVCGCFVLPCEFFVCCLSLGSVGPKAQTNLFLWTPLPEPAPSLFLLIDLI